METKTYFASSVPAALETARRELGEEAMLVTSKPASATARPFGRLEVTFAYDPKAATQPHVRTAVFPVVSREPDHVPIKAPRGTQTPDNRNLVSELDEIRGQISALKQSVRPAGIGQGLRVREVRSTMAEDLSAKGMGQDLAEDIAGAVNRSEAPDAFAKQVSERIPIADFADPKPGETRTVALVGPPGRGKTTTLVKIAVRYGLANRVPVKIYTTGSHGVGCEDQMARYASILGVPFQSCESLEGLNLALNGEAWRGLVLIDTPGISPGDSGGISDLGRFFKRRTEIEKHLVLRAEARSADIAHVIARFAPMEVSRLLFTGLDEAVSLGSMADAMIRSGIPSALAGTGQRIPEDLERVSAARVARALQGESASAAAAA